MAGAQMLIMVSPVFKKTGSLILYTSLYDVINWKIMADFQTVAIKPKCKGYGSDFGKENLQVWFTLLRKFVVTESSVLILGKSTIFNRSLLYLWRKVERWPHICWLMYIVQNQCNKIYHIFIGIDRGLK